MRQRVLYIGAAMAVAAPAVLFAIMQQVDQLNPRWVEPDFHFWIVSACTLLSAVIGAALALSVQSVRTTRTVFLALGFVAVAMIFATHGLGTPGVFVSGTEYPYAAIISAGLSEVVGAFFIFLSVLPSRVPGARIVRDHGAHVLLAAFVLLTAYVGTMVFVPEFWRFIPTSTPWSATLASLTIGMLGYSAWRYWRAWKLTRLPGQFAMVAALVLLAESQLSMYYGVLWTASWWLYHGLMLAAFLTLIAGWAIEAARAKSLVVFSRAIELRDELDHVTVADPEALAALEAVMATKDEYTLHHMGRVAEYAVAIGREMHLDEATLEVVETAGRIHDIGKITVPDAVLLKPGRLTDDEFTQMKHHSTRGEHIARQSKVLAHVGRVVRAHHERFQGRGYPDGLAGNEIPLEARIIAVADTFDALTSTRVYRPSRPWSDAVAEVRRVAGTQLDPDCVDAFLRHLARTGQLEQAPQQRTLAA